MHGKDPITPIRFTTYDLRLIEELRYLLRGATLAATVRHAIAFTHAAHRAQLDRERKEREDEMEKQRKKALRNVRAMERRDRARRLRGA